MRNFELSCGLPPGPDFADLAVYAEELGYRRLWIFDSAPLWEDTFVHLGLAATRTSRLGLATAVLVPKQRSEITAASAIATVARLARGRFRACFGTGATARLTVGQRPMTLRALGDYVAAVRQLLAGETAIIDGAAVRMLHAAGLAAPRPLDVPIWLSVFGPKGAALAGECADGIIGLPNPFLPTATIVSGTVLEAGEQRDASRVREAIGPWRVTDWHMAYAQGGAAAVDALPGGREWRAALEALAPPEHRHLLTFEGHVTHLPDRDRLLLRHINVKTMVGERAEIATRLLKLAAAGYSEIIYTPTGPHVRREMAEMMAAYKHTAKELP